MMKEVKAQTKVSVNIDKLWRALSKDVTVFVPRALPGLVKDVLVLEGDGGLDTILLFRFFGGSDHAFGKSQKERIVEYDESKYKIGLQVIEGGKLSSGFSYYTTYFELSSTQDEQETLVDIKVVYDTINEEDESKPLETTNPTLYYLKCLESCIMSCDA